ncbi:MAG TPA: DUF881 domain-containing protein, partial [Firmicutes bacterium]|nr:DUF881 domain-containing protein [Candidatus Fermentithermobacillaceae bacterium]
RVVATTEIRCAGAVFMINGVRLAPPLKIQAIGDPEVLQNALKMRGGVVDRHSATLPDRLWLESSKAEQVSHR